MEIFEDFGLIAVGALLGAIVLYLYLRKSGRLPKKGGASGTVGGGGGPAKP